MTDENADTADLTMNEKLDRILSELADLKVWRAGVDALLEDRTRETRPKLDLIIKELSDLRGEMTEVRRDLRSVDRKLEIFNTELLEMKVDLRDFDKRLTESERRPN
jgi:hypothetical protein